MPTTMDCLPLITKSTDVPFWIKRLDFNRLVHSQNYLCRNVQAIYPDAYLADWFVPSGVSGVHGFPLPTVYLDAGRIKFINGRHRTAVLLKHLEVVPMAMAVDAASENHDFQALFASIKHADLRLDAPIQLPSLPLLSKADLEQRVDKAIARIPTPDPW